MASIDEYAEEAEKDLVFDINKLAEYAITIGYKIQKWSRYLYQEEKVKDEKENTLAEVYKQRLHYYFFDYEFEIDKKVIDSYIKGDNEYLVAKREFQEQQRICKTIQSILDSFQKISFILSTTQKNLEWRSGN